MTAASRTSPALELPGFEKKSRAAIVSPSNGIFLHESPLRRAAIPGTMRTPGHTHRYQGIPFDKLLADARAGDRDAFGELFKRSQPRVQKWASLRLRGGRVGIAGGSDITQETMILAYRKFPGFLGNTEGEWNKWLRAILTNFIKQSHRFADQDKRDDSDTVFLDSSSGTDVPGREKSPSQVVAQDEESGQAVAYLSLLHGDQGEVFLLRHLQGYSSDEIAGLMKTTPDAVRGLLGRATQGLQRIVPHNLSVATEEALKAYLAYLRLTDAGEEMDRATFVAQHPGCARELQAMFALIDRMQAMWAADSMAKK
jgi:RNA polymerase sigma-70 factor (ECF subfamily)